MQALIMLLTLLVPIVAITRAWRAEGSWHFLNPVNVFWLSFVYAGVAQPLLSADNWIAFYGREVFLTAIAMFPLLGIAFAVGYSLPLGLPVSRLLPDFPKPSQLKVCVAGVLLIALGFLGYFLIIRASGGAEHWLSSPKYNTDYERLSGYTYTMPRLATLGLMILLCHAFSQREAVLYKLFLVGLVAINTLWQAYYGVREGTLMMLVILYGSSFAAMRRNPPIWATALLFPTLIFIFGFVPTYRGDFRDLRFNIQDRPAMVVDRSLDFFSDPNFGSQAPSVYKPDKGPDLWSDFGMAISIVNYVPEKVSYDNGYMLLELLTHGVPRAIWPDKIYPEPESWDRFFRVTNISTSENLVGLRSGPSPTMVGKYYYIGGPLGIVLGGMLSGFCFRALWEFLRRQLRYVTGIILLVASVGLGGMEMIHPFGWSVLFWIPTVFIPFLFFVWISRDASAPVEPKQPRRPDDGPSLAVAASESAAIPVTVPVRRVESPKSLGKRMPNRRSIRHRQS